MYFADISNSSSLNIYKGLLDKYLENPSSADIKNLFEGIIKVAHLLSIGAIKENEIDNTIYNLIVEIVDHNKIGNRAYFQNIDPNNIGEAQFKTLSGILSSLASDTVHELV
ncbi:MAG: hypothetical protein ABIN36_07495 [Ferruginibacter sp.]